jgi:hypothetical protein
MKKSILNVCIIPLLLAGCAMPAAATPIPDQPAPVLTQADPANLPATAAPTQPAAQAITSSPAATQASTAPTPSLAPKTAGNTYEGVTLTIPSGLASDVRADISAPIQPQPDSISISARSAMLELTLNGYPAPAAAFHTAQIRVFSVQDYSQANAEAKTQIATLKDLLANKPTDTDKAPFVPLFNAAQVFHTTLKYIDFQNGSGVRFLTQYDQGITPINNQELFYTFQGITSDGAYYVSVVLPVANSSLPTDGTLSSAEMDTIAKDFITYLTTTVQKLNSEPSVNFKPDLDSLDSMIASLNVAPNLTGLPSALIPPTGLWMSSGNIPGPVSAMSAADIDATMQKSADIYKDKIDFNGQSCPVSGYTITSQDAATYFQNMYQATLQQLGLSYQNVEVIKTNCSIPGFGEFVRTPENTLLVNIDGVFFVFGKD